MNPETVGGDKDGGVNAKPVVAYCRACGKGLEQSAVNNYEGTVYCSDHVPRTSSGSNPYTAPPAASPSNISPGLAFVLGFIPGVGAIYNGQYAKGFVHVLITGMIFSLADRGGADALAPFLIPAWFCYMAFEAYHTARQRLLGEPVDEFSSILPRGSSPDLTPIGPLLLIGFGVVLLAHQLELIDIYRIRRFIAPIALIGIGVFMLYGRVRAAGGNGPSTPAPGAPARSAEETFYGRG